MFLSRVGLSFWCGSLFAITIVLSAIAPSDAFAINGRIAYSADGNQHDRDDIGATPLGLALMAKAGWTSKLVYYGYSDHVWDQNNAQAQDMEESALGAASRFGFNRSKFYNVYKNKEAAYNALASEINKSTSSNPLTIVAAGPMHAVCQSIQRANSANHKYVTVVSHSEWNNGHSHGNSCTSDGIKRTGVRFDKIIDQNQGTRNNSGLNNPYSLWGWLADHSDANLRWVHARMMKAFTGKADPSDAGMVWYLITGGTGGNGDENAHPSKLAKYFGSSANITGSASSGSGSDTSAAESASSAAGENHILEAESGTFVSGQGSWKLESRINGSSGSGYLRWDGPDLFNAPGKDTIRYTFSVSKPGTYRVKLRASRPETGEPSDRNNDFFIRMDGQSWKKIFFGGARNTWNYAQTFDVSHAKSPSQYTLSEGSHTLEISGRSREAIFDRIEIIGGGAVSSSSGGSSASASGGGSSSSSSGGSSSGGSSSSSDSSGGSSSSSSSTGASAAARQPSANGECTVIADSLPLAKGYFEQECGVKYDKSDGHDCDPSENEWVCSSENLDYGTVYKGSNTK